MAERVQFGTSQADDLLAAKLELQLSSLPNYHASTSRKATELPLRRTRPGWAELRRAAHLHDGEPNASDASKHLVELLGIVLARQQERLDRQRVLRADLISAREALLRCHACHRPVKTLACRTCAAMPLRLPRVVDELFCPEDKHGRKR